MAGKTYRQLVAEAVGRITEIAPWDLPDRLKAVPSPILVDIREPAEFSAAHVEGSINVPRGILESAVEWDYAETEPELASSRERPVILICRSGNRSALAALVLADMGFADVTSVRLGIKGWNDADLPLVDGDGRPVDGDEAMARLEPPLPPEKRAPKPT